MLKTVKWHKSKGSRSCLEVCRRSRSTAREAATSLAWSAQHRCVARDAIRHGVGIFALCQGPGAALAQDPSEHSTEVLTDDAPSQCCQVDDGLCVRPC